MVEIIHYNDIITIFLKHLNHINNIFYYLVMLNIV